MYKLSNLSKFSYMSITLYKTVKYILIIQNKICLYRLLGTNKKKLALKCFSQINDIDTFQFLYFGNNLLALIALLPFSNVWSASDGSQ